MAVGGTEAVGAVAAARLNPTLRFDRVRFGGNRVSRIALVEGGGAAGLNVADLVEPRSPRFARAAVLRAPGLQLDRSLIDAETAALAVEIPDHDVADRLARLRTPG
jgi:hypothetical protein